MLLGHSTIASYKHGRVTSLIDVLRHLAKSGIKVGQESELISKLSRLLDIDNLSQEFQRRRQKMLADKIDVTGFLVWFLKNYPESAKIMKENPEYQWKPK